MQMIILLSKYANWSKQEVEKLDLTSFFEWFALAYEIEKESQS